MALQNGNLQEAEDAFREVLQVDPQSGAAYTNLGVVYMRRKQWAKAVNTLEKAERLMPQTAGVRLNIGLAYYRQNQFLKAIPPLEAVVREQPDAVQARIAGSLLFLHRSLERCGGNPRTALATGIVQFSVLVCA